MPSFFEIDPMVLERIILRFRQSIFSILKKRVALHLNKIEFPSPKDILCQVWLKSAQWFLRKIFLNFVHVFSLFRNYLPLEKCIALHLNNLNLISSTRGCFVFSLVEIGTVVLEKRIFKFRQCIIKRGPLFENT